MRHRLRRAGGFAAVATLALAAPRFGWAAAAPFAAVAVLAAFVVDDGPLFELFARPGDHEDGRLNGLAGFGLAATGLAILTAVREAPMPDGVFVATVLLVAFGNLGHELVRTHTTDEFLTTVGFLAGGFLAGTAGQAAAAAVADSLVPARVPEFVFLAAVGALVAALFRSVLFARDDALVMVTVAFLLWLFAALVGTVSATTVAVGLAVAVAFGWLSYALDVASITGMLTGVLLSAVTVVLGGYGWFVVLITFFAVGGLSSKFRYEVKRERGVAEDNDGARGTGNVLGNATVALVAVVAAAAAARFLPGRVVLGWPVHDLLAFAFAGSLAAAMADTLSSEFGGLFDDPRLVTTLEPVDPGTDGAVTWQGELAGVVGAALVGAIAAVLMPVGSATTGVGFLVVAGAGVVGMSVDSLLGATVEGDRFGNQTVNFLATLSGAIAGVGFALAAFVALLAV
ncbi:DUF92 domain-containing protein [Candidatus Halobonum tyrrellensis]|uniref:DUF92 domain-containing protein n=1 Tax=Candidatus Halobonum tyrrellensis G22 TaxID=1324957 RepID=V4HEE2_9EURY|nr:DUF92 domain-containing protein [Candidatus Halobonum tyrrellensis]ESP88443.1 hypothetical protein K933_08287 [Candidatus Halobonum tyrrellensis G22]